MDIPIFHWTLVRALNILGFWPNNPNPIPQILLCATLVIICPFQLQDIYRTFDNVPLLMDVFRDFSTFLLLIIKFLIMWYNKRYVILLIEEISEDWRRLKVSKDQEIMDKYVKYANIFCTFDCILYILAALFYYPETLISYLSKPVEARKLVLDITYPFNCRPSPFFEIVTIIQTVLIFLMISADALSEILLGTLVFHIGGLIEILMRDITGISVACSSTNKQNLSSLIKSIVNEHERLINMINKLETVYTYVCLIQFFSSTMVICFTGFIILNSNGTNDTILMLKFIMFIILMLWQAFAFCFAGEFLITKSADISQRIYSCSWYELKPKDVKLLLIVMRRTQQPLQLTVGKFAALSIGSFTNIVKTSASYLSVLRTIVI